MKYLGIDYGEKNIGIAISNSTGTMAFPHSVLKNSENVIEEILKIVKENKVERIVVGKPVNLSGKENISTNKAKMFYENLSKHFDKDKIVMFDERLTTSLAHVIGGRMGVKNKKRKKDVDKIAASIILNDYLQSVSGESE